MWVFPCGGGFRVGVTYGKEFDFNKSKELLACVACWIKGAHCNVQKHRVSTIADSLYPICFALSSTLLTYIVSSKEEIVIFHSTLRAPILFILFVEMFRTFKWYATSFKNKNLWRKTRESFRIFNSILFSKWSLQIQLIMPKTCVEAAKVLSLINVYVMGQSKMPIIKEKKIELWGPHD